MFVPSAQYSAHRLIAFSIGLVFLPRLRCLRKCGWYTALGIASPSIGTLYCSGSAQMRHLKREVRRGAQQFGYSAPLNGQHHELRHETAAIRFRQRGHWNPLVKSLQLIKFYFLNKKLIYEVLSSRLGDTHFITLNSFYNTEPLKYRHSVS